MLFDPQLMFDELYCCVTVIHATIVVKLRKPHDFIENN